MCKQKAKKPQQNKRENQTVEMHELQTHSNEIPSIFNSNS